MENKVGESKLSENEIIELQNAKVKSDKRLLISEIVLGVLSLISFLVLFFVASCAKTELNNTMLFVVTLIAAIVILTIGCAFCLYLEQKTGYYVCKKCKHKYIPTYMQVLLAPHVGWTRYMKCPHCKKLSWNKKVLK